MITKSTRWLLVLDTAFQHMLNQINIYRQYVNVVPRTSQIGLVVDDYLTDGKI